MTLVGSLSQRRVVWLLIKYFHAHIYACSVVLVVGMAYNSVPVLKSPCLFFHWLSLHTQCVNWHSVPVNHSLYIYTSVIGFRDPNLAAFHNSVCVVFSIGRPCSLVYDQLAHNFVECLANSKVRVILFYLVKDCFKSMSIS